MRPKKDSKIPVNAPLPGLNAALANLAVPNLPDGPPALQPGTKPAAAAWAWKLGRVVLRRERARRGGKTVIVIDGFATHLPSSVIETTAKKARRACGSGGTVKGRTVEIQGDQAARVRAALEEQGFEVGGVG